MTFESYLDKSEDTETSPIAAPPPRHHDSSKGLSGSKRFVGTSVTLQSTRPPAAISFKLFAPCLTDATRWVAGSPLDRRIGAASRAAILSPVAPTMTPAIGSAKRSVAIATTLRP